MNNQNKFITKTHAVCIDCGNIQPYSLDNHLCSSCSNPWLEAQYDYSNLSLDLLTIIKNRPMNLWRYKELLPVDDNHPSIFMGEGGTPLIHAQNLGMMLGCPLLFIKDERQGPTHSFKDRQAAVSIAALMEAGIAEMVLASTGNVAISYSAYAARAGIRLYAFITSMVSDEKMREAAIYGTQVFKVTGTYDQAKTLAAEYAKQRGIYLERGARSIPSVESMKTIAFEIAEQLTEYFDIINNKSPNHHNFRTNGKNNNYPAMISPDWYVQAVSGGIGPLGVQKGFRELLQMKIIPKNPSLAAIQTKGCAPMVHAWRENLDEVSPILNPNTHIATLSTGDPGRSYTLLRRQIISNTGGIFESISDEEAFRALMVVAKMEGLSIEPAAAVAFAGLMKLVRKNVIKPDEIIVVNCSGHTIPITGSILGDRWSVDVNLSNLENEKPPQEGLLSALSQLHPHRFSRIMIIDDMPDSRLLIRRILQMQGNYEIIETSSGTEAIKLINNQLPDLIILDLMMPEMDGFSVVDTLHQIPEFKNIPIIIVTARDLTRDEKNRLLGKVHSMMQKGNFLTDELLKEVHQYI